MNQENKLLTLYKKINSSTATAETFEEAIKEEGLTCEMIILLSDYYKKDVPQWKQTIGGF